MRTSTRKPQFATEPLPVEPLPIDPLPTRPAFYGPTTMVLEIDLRDPDALRVTNTLSIEGRYISARAVGNTARIAVTSPANDLGFLYPSSPNAEESAEEGQPGTRPEFDDGRLDSDLHVDHDRRTADDRVTSCRAIRSTRRRNSPASTCCRSCRSTSTARSRLRRRPRRSWQPVTPSTPRRTVCTCRPTCGCTPPSTNRSAASGRRPTRPRSIASRSPATGPPPTRPPDPSTVTCSTSSR